jgi:hypothetical protein
MQSGFGDERRPTEHSRNDSATWKMVKMGNFVQARRSFHLESGSEGSPGSMISGRRIIINVPIYQTVLKATIHEFGVFPIFQQATDHMKLDVCLGGSSKAKNRTVCVEQLH